MRQWPTSADAEAMKYDVRLSAAAKEDILRNADYIELVLKNPSAAGHFLDETEEKLRSLSEFPERSPLVRDKLLASWGIRFLPVMNYMVFYQVMAEQKTVYVVRVLHGKSNWSAILFSDSQ